MSAYCSLDEPGKPSFVEHPSRLPPRQIAPASSGARQPPRLTTMQACTSHAGHRGPCSPTQLQRRRACRRTAHPGAGGTQPWPPGTPVTSEGMHRWFPAVVPDSPISVSKRPSSCGNSGGRRWVRTTGFSLVRRDGVRIAPSFPGLLMHLSTPNSSRTASSGSQKRPAGRTWSRPPTAASRPGSIRRSPGRSWTPWSRAPTGHEPVPGLEPPRSVRDKGTREPQRDRAEHAGGPGPGARAPSRSGERSAHDRTFPVH